MDTIIRTIEAALQENLETIVLMLIVVGSLNTINIILGTIVGSVTTKFDFKKFMFGILKALITGVCIFCLCYSLNLFALTLQLTKDVVISSDFISTLEVFAILAIWAIDIAKDVLDKIKSIKVLKYVSYEDINDYSIDERG